MVGSVSGGDKTPPPSLSPSVCLSPSLVLLCVQRRDAASVGIIGGLLQVRPVRTNCANVALPFIHWSLLRLGCSVRVRMVVAGGWLGEHQLNGRCQRPQSVVDTVSDARFHTQARARERAHTHTHTHTHTHAHAQPKTNTQTRETYHTHTNVPALRYPPFCARRSVGSACHME